MTTEITIIEALADDVRASSKFDSDDVTIGDWGVLDGSNLAAPYVVFRPADDFRILYRVKTPEQSWSILLDLFEAFIDFDESMVEFIDSRRALIAAVAAGTGTTGLSLREIRANTNVDPVYPMNNDPEFIANAIPTFLTQEIVIECEVF